MTSTVGFSVSTAAVHAVIVRDRVEHWRSSVAVAESDTMQVAVERLLRSAPVVLLRRSTVSAALSPKLAPVRRLSGLPAISDDAVLLQLVRANPGRFFVLAQKGPVTPVVHRAGDVCSATLIDCDTVEALNAACAAMGLRLVGAGPALTVADATEDPFSVALAAAEWTRATPLFLPSRGGVGARARRLRRMALLAASAVAAFGAVSAPLFGTEWRIRSDRRELALLSASVEQAAPATQRLRQSNAGLEQIARFARNGRSMTGVLAAIASALPDSTAVVSLRVDTTSGSMTLLSTAAASVIARLTSAPSIRDAKVGGAVTREEVGGARLQRVTVRFRLPPDTVRSRASQ